MKTHTAFAAEPSRKMGKGKMAEGMGFEPTIGLDIL